MNHRTPPSCKTFVLGLIGLFGSSILHLPNAICTATLIFNFNVLYNCMSKRSAFGFLCRLLMDGKVATPRRESNRSCSPNSIRQVRGVVFDMDGTLTLPTLDFAEMKRRLKLPPSSDILVSVQAMSGEDKEKSMAIIEEMEDEANRRLRLQPGVLDVLHFLAQRGLGRALMTRNSDKSVRVFVEHVRQLCADKYPLFSQQPLFSQVCMCGCECVCVCVCLCVYMCVCLCVCLCVYVWV